MVSVCVTACTHSSAIGMAAIAANRERVSVTPIA